MNVQYVHGSYRLNNPLFVDYYFLCTTTDTTLQWKVNGIFLGGFQEGETGRVLAGPRTNFNFSAVLLSSYETASEGPLRFMSILTISLNSEALLEVYCLNNVVNDSTTNGDRSMDSDVVEAKDNDTVVVALQPLFCAVENSSKTYVFMCGGKLDVQSWEFASQSFIFRSTDKIGEHLFTLSPDNTTANNLAFIFAHEPFIIISILFVRFDLNVSESLDMNISCIAGKYHAEIPIQAASTAMLPITATKTTTNQCKLNYCSIYYTLKIFNFQIRYFPLQILLVAILFYGVLHPKYKKVFSKS